MGLSFSYGSMVTNIENFAENRHDFICVLGIYSMVLSFAAGMTPLDMVHPNPMMERLSKIWELLGSCSMWHIWKARCTGVLSGDIVPIQQVVQGIWSELVFTLKARFDNIKGNSNMSTQKRLSLLKLWDRMEMYSGNHLKVEWSFSTLRWLFPPPITWWSVKHRMCAVKLGCDYFHFFVILLLNNERIFWGKTKYTHKSTQVYFDTYRHSYIQTNKQTYIHTNKHTFIHMHIHT